MIFLYIKYKGANDNESSCCQSPMVVFCSRPIEEKMTNHNFLTSSCVDHKKNESQDTGKASQAELSFIYKCFTHILRMNSKRKFNHFHLFPKYTKFIRSLRLNFCCLCSSKILLAILICHSIIIQVVNFEAMNSNSLLIINLEHEAFGIYTQILA